MIISLTKAQLLKGQVIQPGWYKAIISKYEAKQPKSGSGDSLNHVFTFTLEGSDAEVDHNFNTKAMIGFGAFVAAVQGKTLASVLEEIGSGTLNFDADGSVGKKIQFRLVNKEYEGRLTNKVDAENNAFLPYDAAIPF